VASVPTVAGRVGKSSGFCSRLSMMMVGSGFIAQAPRGLNVAPRRRSRARVACRVNHAALRRSLRRRQRPAASDASSLSRRQNSRLSIAEGLGETSPSNVADLLALVLAFTASEPRFSALATGFVRLPKPFAACPVDSARDNLALNCWHSHSSKKRGGSADRNTHPRPGEHRRWT